MNFWENLEPECLQAKCSSWRSNYSAADKYNYCHNIKIVSNIKKCSPKSIFSRLIQTVNVCSVAYNQAPSSLLKVGSHSVKVPIFPVLPDSCQGDALCQWHATVTLLCAQCPLLHWCAAMSQLHCSVSQPGLDIICPIHLRHTCEHFHRRINPGLKCKHF